MPALADAFEVLKPILRCPSCRALLTREPGTLTCDGCRHLWPCAAGGHLDLRLPAWNEGANRWRERQQETIDYYTDLKAKPEQAAVAFRSDFGRFADTLGRYTGRVVDVGGGHGIAREFLAPTVHYVSVDPSSEWLSDDWNALAPDFACLTRPLAFVQAFAERLPFDDGSFDVALCLWTANHCAHPAAAIREIARVVRPGGRILVVLEDGEPSWGGIL